MFLDTKEDKQNSVKHYHKTHEARNTYFYNLEIQKEQEMIQFCLGKAKS